MLRKLLFAFVILPAAAGAEEATLRAVSAFQEGTSFSRPFEAFIRKVNEDGKGRVRIVFVGGPRAMPPFELGNALRGGVVDVINASSAFYANLLPEGEALKMSTRSMKELRENGGWDLLNRLHNEKVNAYYLARHGEGIPFHLYLTRRIESPDLRGLTIRTSPTYRAFFTALGANLVNTPPGEVYTALERGVVQGYGWPAVGIFDLGWQERTRYRVDPGFYTVDVNILVNLPKWNSLSGEQKDVLIRAARWLEESQIAGNGALTKAELARQDQAGIGTIAFSGETRAAFEKAAREAGWAEVEKAAPQTHKELRRLLSAD